MARTDPKSTSKARRGGRIGSASIGRALSLMAFLPVASRVPMYARLVTALVIDERMPAGRKALLAGAAGYLVLGRDLIPDEIPIIGGLDDLVVVVLAVDLFLDGVPEDLLREKLDELGHPALGIRARRRPDPTLDARTGPADHPPGPGAHRDTASDTFRQLGLGPRLRGWITREDHIA